MPESLPPAPLIEETRSNDLWSKYFQVNRTSQDREPRKAKRQGFVALSTSQLERAPSAIFYLIPNANHLTRVAKNGQREIAVASVPQACHQRANLHASHASDTLLG